MYLCNCDFGDLVKNVNNGFKLLLNAIFFKDSRLVDKSEHNKWAIRSIPNTYRQILTHWWRSAFHNFFFFFLSSLKLCTDPLSLHKWFGLFQSPNLAGWSYILLILVRLAAYFPWVFKCNFMCELVVARLWKTDILALHRCVNNRKLTHTPTLHKHMNRHEHKQTNIQWVCRSSFSDVLFKVWCSVFDAFVVV